MYRANNIVEKLTRQLIAGGGRYTQKQMALLLDCQQGCLSAWLRGKNQMKQVEVLLRLLDFLPSETWFAIIKEELNPTRPPNKQDLASKKRRKKTPKPIPIGLRN